ncbi:hypothetical protein Dxin01_02779 [Deinococcus xinjiangensis]|uniref:Lipoprotein n=1 Tax=Deinococcus xinjiangensis TaxID=457454 RepID=A0ABP9VFL9_9DEIO
MRKLLTLLLPLSLAACGFTAPPRDNAQFVSTLYGVEITWRLVNPGTLGTDGRYAYVGYAQALPFGSTCVIDIDPTLARHQLAHVAAHEAGHCLSARYALLGPKRPDLGPYFDSLTEGFAETYAQAYTAACGDSLKPLGWQDLAAPTCTEAPDPRTVKAEAR